MNQVDVLGKVLNRSDIAAKVDQSLHQYCLEKINMARVIGPGYVELWQEIDAYIAGGGKRIRPYLVFLAYEAYGGETTDSILPVACAWELLHTCFLIHDDIIDRDSVRHGKPNIAGVYQKKYEKSAKAQSSHYAQSAALLAGDLLLSGTLEIVGQSSLSAEDKHKVNTYLQSALFSAGGGQLLDVESVLSPVAESDAISIAYYKTATYSFQLPMLCGAVLANAPDNQLKKLEQLGLEMGIAYQLSDDLLGIFGDQDQTGKSNRSDIREKKRTLLVQTAIEELDVSQKEFLEQVYNLNYKISNEEVEQVFSLLQSSGAEQNIQNQISDRAATAKQLVSELTISQDHQQVLTELIDKLTVRTK